MQLFGFSGTSGFMNFLYTLGRFLVGAYGISSILIPIFLFASSLVCFSEITLKKCIYLSSSLFPFFTSVLIEKLYRANFLEGAGPVQVMKICFLITLILMLSIIELLLAEILVKKIIASAMNGKVENVSVLNDNDSDIFEADDEMNFLADTSDDDSDLPFETGKSDGEENILPSEDEATEPLQNTEIADVFLNLDLENIGNEDEKQNIPIPLTTESLTQTEEMAESPVKELEPCENENVANLEPSEKVDENEEVAIPVPSEKVDANESIANLEPNESVDPNENTANLEPNKTQPADESQKEIVEKPQSVFDETVFDENGINYCVSDKSEFTIDEIQSDVKEEAKTESTETPEEIEISKIDNDTEEAFPESEIIEGNSELIDDVQSADVFSQMEDDIRQDMEETIEDDNTIPDWPAVENDENDFSDDNTYIEEDSFPEVMDAEDVLNEAKADDEIAEFEVEDETAKSVDPLFGEVQIVSKEDEKKDAAETPLVPRRNHSYKIPTEGLLTEYEDGKYWIIDEDTKLAAGQLKETLNEFKIEAEVTDIRKGPVVTMFEILPAPGVKLSRIVALQDNIALRLAASSVRIVAPIPGKRAVGIEVPNKDRAIVSFREVIEEELTAYKKMQVPVILGKDIEGEAQVIDLVKTPHLLIAGSTGSGKSVCVNSIILSILYKRSPQQVKMILIDPKIVELKLYNDIPHLLTPVITESKRAFQSLQYCLCEMERRYAMLDGMGVRDIVSYNNRIEERNIAAEKIPYIVVIIDEFADLMATTGKELESTVARLAAMSRAVGIHLVLATQRPSIDVITGLIKANIPSRIAFMVASKMDSRIIIDQVGAEKLLGRGDMLYSSATDPFPIRIQGTFVSDNEVENVVDYVKQFGPPEYIDDEIFVEDEEESSEPNLFSDGDDPLYNKALEVIVEAGKASASYIQRRLKIGYNRAARLVEEMEARGIVGPANGSKPREIIHLP